MKNPVSASDMAQGSQISDNNPARNWNGNATASLGKKTAQQGWTSDWG